MKLYYPARHLRMLIMAVLVGFLLLPPQPTYAAGCSLQKLVSGLNAPVAIVALPGDSDRLFVVELAGKIRLVKNRQLVDQPFLDLTSVVTTKVYGQGLFNVAFDPDYARNGFFYVIYSDPQHNEVLARYSVSASNADQADAASGKILLTIAHPHDFHYGGQLAFGPDGYLYISTGDGGTAYDKEGNAQNRHSLLGAVLRLDVDHGDPYSIPPSNPYSGDSAARPELWAKGLRNVWRFSFDALTGDLYFADVGEAVYEEIDYQQAGDKGGENYGWPRYEGTHDILGGSKTGLIFPVSEYTHIDANCAVVGGYVYRGTLLPELAGRYLFADYCSGQLWTLIQTKGRWTLTALMKVNMNIAAFGQGNDGEIYAADLKTNAVYVLGRP